MNSKVIENYSRLKPSFFILPCLILAAVAGFLYFHDALDAKAYVYVQKDFFIYLNAWLSQFPQIQYNLTQLGDALISLSLLSIFIVYAPALWESLISVSLISLIISSGLKNLFSVPRPAAILDTNSFVIIGQKLPGFSSLPSGHSITIFTSLTVLLFAFMPEKPLHRQIWITSLISAGIVMAFSRVGVGAHYPLDVMVGATIGYTSGLAGILVSRHYKIWSWVSNKRYYPVLMLLILGCSISLIIKIIDEPLPVFFLACLASLFSLYKITHAYIQK
jgi:membrane-associated phospholipid phosphatase